MQARTWVMQVASLLFALLGFVAPVQAGAFLRVPTLQGFAPYEVSCFAILCTLQGLPCVFAGRWFGGNHARACVYPACIRTIVQNPAKSQSGAIPMLEYLPVPHLSFAPASLMSYLPWRCREEKASYSTSQPEPGTGGTLWESGAASIDKLVQGISFSQPACPDHMLVNSQLLGTPGSSQVLRGIGGAAPRVFSSRGAALRYLGCKSAASVISGCDFAMLGGVRLCNGFRLGMQLCKFYCLGMQPCSMRGATLQYLGCNFAILGMRLCNIYHLRLQVCKIFSIRGQLSNVYSAGLQCF